MTNDDDSRNAVSQNFFENGLSGVRLPVVGSLVDFVFVCWCSRVPTHYAMSVTANG